MEDGCHNAALENRECRCKTCTSLVPWVDEATAAVEMRFVVFNPTYGVFSRLQVYVIFSRGGRLWKRMEVESVHSSSAAGPDGVGVVAGIVWLLLILWIMFWEFLDVFQTIKCFGVSGVWEKYLGFWNGIDLVSIANAIVIVITYV
jgi:hypothetical protein